MNLKRIIPIGFVTLFIGWRLLFENPSFFMDWFLINASFLGLTSLVWRWAFVVVFEISIFYAMYFGSTYALKGYIGLISYFKGESPD